VTNISSSPSPVARGSTLMPTPTAVLRASLEQHNDVFESLLKLIPAQFYIIKDETEDQVRQDFITLFFLKKLKVVQVASKYQKHSKKRKAPKQAIKEASKKAKLDKVLFKCTNINVNNYFFYDI
jgi:60S ribosome biogenesis protein Rrp14